MKEPTPICYFQILRKDKIALILKHKFLPHPKLTLTLTLFSQFVFYDKRLTLILDIITKNNTLHAWLVNYTMLTKPK